MIPDLENFQFVHEGESIVPILLKNETGMQVLLSNYGARIISWVVRDREGKERDIVLGFDSIQGYFNAKEKFHGAFVGRYANRISKGRLELDHQVFQLPLNAARHHLHGGEQGFHCRVWKVEEQEPASVLLSYVSTEGEEGYPGTLNVKLRYALSDSGELRIHASAETDRSTVVSFTCHPYFNLGLSPEHDVLDHLLRINGMYFTEPDTELIPTGRVLPVKDTALDFSDARLIGENIQAMEMDGYDHNYVFENEGKLIEMARVYCPDTGLALLVESSEPGMQFYTANSLDGSDVGKRGVAYQKHSAFCLEPQHYPDSPNHPDFPSTRLDPGQRKTYETIYKVFVES